MAKRNQFSTT